MEVTWWANSEGWTVTFFGEGEALDSVVPGPGLAVLEDTRDGEEYRGLRRRYREGRRRKVYANGRFFVPISVKRTITLPVVKARQDVVGVPVVRKVAAQVGRIAVRRSIFGWIFLNCPLAWRAILSILRT